MHAQSHQSDPRILGRRSLQRDHRCLAEMLRPGLSVLDVGCGTGAITAGIAKAVGPAGEVLGVDRDAGLLEIARREHGGIPNLRFELGDAIGLQVPAHFDIVTAARTLQWISEPVLAVLQMKQASKPSGWLVVLDYSHTQNQWEPEPPAEFRNFYQAFLAWRQANNWDNEMAEHLPRLFESAGLAHVESHVQDEVAERGSPGFASRTAIWSEVIENLGEQLVQAGFLGVSRLQEASRLYAAWVRTALVKQTLIMRAVVGKVV